MLRLPARLQGDMPSGSQPRLLPWLITTPSFNELSSAAFAKEPSAVDPTKVPSKLTTMPSRVTIIQPRSRVGIKGVR